MPQLTILEFLSVQPPCPQRLCGCGNGEDRQPQSTEDAEVAQEKSTRKTFIRYYRNPCNLRNLSMIFGFKFPSIQF